MAQAAQKETETALRRGPGKGFSWDGWREEWFGTPGDVDDFIFYDSRREGREEGHSGR